MDSKISANISRIIMCNKICCFKYMFLLIVIIQQQELISYRGAEDYNARRYNNASGCILRSSWRMRTEALMIYYKNISTQQEKKKIKIREQYALEILLSLQFKHQCFLLKPYFHQIRLNG